MRNSSVHRIDREPEWVRPHAESVKPLCHRLHKRVCKLDGLLVTGVLFAGISLYRTDFTSVTSKFVNKELVNFISVV